MRACGCGILLDWVSIAVEAVGILVLLFDFSSSCIQFQRAIQLDPFEVTICTLFRGKQSSSLYFLAKSCPFLL
jgi:hypothetical protein